MNSEKVSIIASLPLLFGLLDLLVGDSVLMKAGIITENNKMMMFYILASIAGLLLIISLVSSVVKGGALSIVLGFFILGAGLGWVWDILTSVMGLYTIFTPSGNNTNTVVALILAIVGTTFCFIITLFSPGILAHQEVTPIIKIISSILFVLGLGFDFWTSFVGNARLLRLSIEVSNIGTMVILGMCTLFVCCCQYVMIAYIGNAQAEKS